MVDISRRFLLRHSLLSNQQSLPWLKNPKTFVTECTRCQQCIAACENNIIVIGVGGFPTINFKNGECTFCYKCADVCEEKLFKPITSTAWQQQISIDELFR